MLQEQIVSRFNKLSQGLPEQTDDTYVRIANLRTENRTWNLQNTELQYYPLKCEDV